MKNVILLVVAFCALFSTACAAETEVTPPKPPTPVTPPAKSDTLHIRVLAYMDRASVEGHLGGSERVVKSRMNTLFRTASNYWNECAHGKLDYIYTYTLADMIVYDGSSSDAAFRRKVYDDPLDFNKYDVVVLFDCMQDNGESGNGGAACGGGNNHRSVVTVIAGKEPKDLFNDATYRTLVHEFGHYRGVTDLYQYIIDAKDNPVSNEKFEVEDCVMNWAGAGKWSEYAILCINRAGKSKQIGKDFDDFFGAMYPSKIEFKVTVGNVPQRGVTVNLYGSRAGSSSHGRDIVPQVFVWGQTNGEGVYAIFDTRKYFIPNKNEFSNLPTSLPYGRWFGFLAEVIHGTSKKYVWISEYQAQMPFLRGESTFRVTVAF